MAFYEGAGTSSNEKVHSMLEIGKHDSYTNDELAIIVHPLVICVIGTRHHCPAQTIEHKVYAHCKKLSN